MQTPNISKHYLDSSQMQRSVSLERIDKFERRKTVKHNMEPLELGNSNNTELHLNCTKEVSKE